MRSPQPPSASRATKSPRPRWTRKTLPRPRLPSAVAYYLYDKASIRRVTQQVVTYAVVADMGFAWPYWDNDNVCIKTFGLNECYWEPGLRFDDSPWHCVEQGMTPLGDADRRVHRWGTGPRRLSFGLHRPQPQVDGGRNLVTVTEYLERPSKEFPKGRWLTLANARVIAGVANVGGEKCLPPLPLDRRHLHHPAVLRRGPGLRPQPGSRPAHDRPRPHGAGFVVEALEWKNRALMPQILAPVGSMKGRRTDAPGAINYYVPVGGQVPQWETVPPIPPRAVRDRRPRSGDGRRHRCPERDPESGRSGQGNPGPDRARLDRTSGVPRLARGVPLPPDATLSRTVSGVRRSTSHPLDSRTLGWEPIKDFKGAQLRDQVDVRVLPGSLVPITERKHPGQARLHRQTFPGYLSTPRLRSRDGLWHGRGDRRRTSRTTSLEPTGSSSGSRTGR
jgi:hypothetical protein